MAKRKDPRYLSGEQAELLFSKIPVLDTDYLVAFRMMYELCLRVSEACNLRVRDIDFRDNVVRIIDSKSGDRTLYMPSSMANLLEKHVKGKKPGDYVVARKDARPFDKWHLHHRVKKYAEWAGLTQDVLGFEMTCHKLRHTGAREYLKRGIMNIEELRKFLGHRYITTTSIYLETMGETIKEKLAGRGLM